MSSFYTMPSTPRARIFLDGSSLLVRGLRPSDAAASSMPSVLFVCTGDLYRSPLAAAFLRQRLHHRGLANWRMKSSGTWAVSQQPLPHDVIREARLFGLGLQEHTTRMVTQDLLADPDLIPSSRNPNRGRAC